MTHQSGITSSDRLLDIFASAKVDGTRLLKIGIENEQIVLREQKMARSTWDADFDGLVRPCVHEGEPCYLLYRLDSANNLGYEWLFITYSPDDAHPKKKMLFAATKATLRKEFSSGAFKHDMFCVSTDEVSLRGYQQFLDSMKMPGPLTQQEEELLKVKQDEKYLQTSVNSKHETMQSVAFPVQSDALSQICALAEGSSAVNYVQLEIDTANERILMTLHRHVSANQLSELILTTTPRYHIYNFDHFWEGSSQKNIVFIYSMPESMGSIPVKVKMLYSACQASFLSTIQRECGINVDRKLQVTDPEDVNEEFLMNELHPTKSSQPTRFAKPKPAGRGRRL